MSKTKSESNLFQPKLDYVAVEISLDDDKVQQITEKAKDINGSSESVKPPSSLVSSPTETKKGRSGLFEEGFNEFFGVSKTGDSDAVPRIEITLDDLDLISEKTTEYVDPIFFFFFFSSCPFIPRVCTILKSPRRRQNVLKSF